jgi:hypothetical protein
LRAIVGEEGTEEGGVAVGVVLKFECGEMGGEGSDEWGYILAFYFLPQDICTYEVPAGEARRSLASIIHCLLASAYAKLATCMAVL